MYTYMSNVYIYTYMHHLELYITLMWKVQSERILKGCRGASSCIVIRPATHQWYGCVWKCCVPLNPMVLLIIIPMKNGYFIGKINPTFSDKAIWSMTQHTMEWYYGSRQIITMVVGFYIFLSFFWGCYIMSHKLIIHQKIYLRLAVLRVSPLYRVGAVSTFWNPKTLWFGISPKNGHMLYPSFTLWETFIKNELERSSMLFMGSHPL